MNPTAMEIGSDKDVAPHMPEGPKVLTGDFYKRIIRIAGLGAGDTAVYVAGGNAPLETLLDSMGVRYEIVSTHFEEDRPSNKAPCATGRAHTLLWDADDASWDHPTQTLANLRQGLRPGGRLVLWRSSIARRDRPPCPEAIERLLVSAGFVSVIAGRLPIMGQSPVKVMDAVVATGILVNRTKVYRIRRG